MKYLLKRQGVTLMKAKGWKQVFKFTYLQMIRSKAYIVSTVIIAACLLLMSLGINFLPGLLAENLGDLFGGSGNDEAQTTLAVETLYISDLSEIIPAPDFGFFSELGVEVVMISADEIEGITAQVKTSREAIALIEITKQDLTYNLLASRPEYEGSIDASDCNTVINYMTWAVWYMHQLSIGVPAESIDYVTAQVTSQVTIAGESPRNEFAVLLANSILPIISALVLFMFIIMYGQLTAQAIATEKTSRVMETLLTSVRPMAVILGKVLGMGLASFTQFAVLFLTGFGASAIVAPFGALGQVFGSVEIPIDDVEMQMVQNAFGEAFSGFNAMSVVWIIVIFLLGFLFYSLIAGLFGATISRIEDLQSALQPMSLIGVLGFMMAYISPIFNIEELSGDGVNIVQRISYYLPISSPFALPAAIISGEMSTGGILISVTVLAVFCVLMLMFVSKVYETIVMHTGNRITVGAMFKMAKK
jgi:ABC-2 type transport system permease protein